VKREMNVPEDFNPIAPIVVGIPAAAVAPTPRHEPQLLAWLP